MTATQFLAIVRPRIGDTAKATFDDTELLEYLNDAIEQLSAERIAAKDPQMIVQASVTPGTTTVPSGFQSFAGQFPLYLVGNVITALDGTTTARIVRYFAVKPRLASLADNVPFGDESIPILLNYVTTASLARVGADAQVEGALGIRQAGVVAATNSSIGRARAGGVSRQE